MSEFGWPSAFFNRFFPVLGSDFGLGALGVFQCLCVFFLLISPMYVTWWPTFFFLFCPPNCSIGAAVLSHFVDDFALVSAFFLFALGCVNIIVGLIWRSSAKVKRSITSWRELDKHVLPVHATGFSTHSNMSSFAEKNGDVVNDDALFMNSTGRSGMGFGRQGEKAAATRGMSNPYSFPSDSHLNVLAGFTITPPMESLPKYIPRPGSSSAQPPVN